VGLLSGLETCDNPPLSYFVGCPAYSFASEPVEDVPNFGGSPRVETPDLGDAIPFGEFPSDGGFDSWAFEKTRCGGTGGGFAMA
jgi:hypothetical protein